MTTPNPREHRWWLTLLLAAACGDDGTGPETTTAIGDPPSSSATADASDTGMGSDGNGTGDGTGSGSATGAGDGAVTLTVAVNGPGGSVTSDPPGIECGGGGADDCTEDYPIGTEVTLTATAAGAFVGWAGACSGSDAQCIVTLTENTEVSASFAL